MQSYVIRANRQTQIIKMLAFKGETQTIEIDYRPWADDNGAVTSVTVSLKSGQATVANESITSSVKTMTVALSEEGSSLLKLVSGGAGNNVHVAHLYILTKDPEVVQNDYGIVI